MRWESKTYNKQKTVCSINGVGKTGQPCGKEWNWVTILHNTQKLTEHGLLVQNYLNVVRPEIIKILEENTGGKLPDISLAIFFYILLMQKQWKKKLSETTSNKMLLHSKKKKKSHLQYEKATYSMEENTFKSYIYLTRGYFSKYKKNLQLNKKQKYNTNHSIKHRQKIWIDIFSIEDTQLADMFNIRNHDRNAIKTTVRYHLAPVRRTVPKKTRKTKYW